MDSIKTYASFVTPCKIAKSFSSCRTANMWVKMHKKKCDICKDLKFNDSKPSSVNKMTHSQESQKFIQNINNNLNSGNSYYFQNKKTGETFEGKVIKTEDGEIMVGIYGNGKFQIIPLKEIQNLNQI